MRGRELKRFTTWPLTLALSLLSGARGSAAAWIFCLFLLTPPALAHRYVCNGYDSLGVTTSDHCGACDDKSAARWFPSAFAVNTNLNSLPESITADQWLSLLDEALSKWNSIPGTSLKMMLQKESSERNFGSDSLSHSIYWITDPEEWRKEVGGGEYNTLGLTLLPYSCPDHQSAFRVIYDGDLVLNGTKNFKWQSSCAIIDKNCSSIRNTLTHELGHIAGLGHPCLQGESSIMCALAKSNIEKPLRDDHEGILTLYPKSSGTLGSVCQKEEDCAEDLSCIVHHNSSYCSTSCESEQPCPLGTSCSKQSPKFCQITRSWLADIAQEGESCTEKACAEDLVCAGAAGSFFCFAPCSAQKTCKNAQQKCAPLANTAGVCFSKAGPLERCGPNILCAGEHRCAQASSNAHSYCRALCSVGCSKDEACVQVEDEQLCMPLKAEEDENRDILAQDSGCNCASKASGSSGLQLYIFGALWYTYNWVHRRPKLLK